MSRYKDIEIVKKTGIRKYTNTIVYPIITPKVDDIYIIAREGDRLDNLAFQFYGDSTLWWFIAQTNNLSTMNVPKGTSLRISFNTSFAIGR